MPAEHGQPIQVVHASPGRLRLRIPRAISGNGALQDAEAVLASVAGVEAIRSNALANSLVVLYDRSMLDGQTLL